MTEREGARCVLVTGATGTLGRHVVEALAGRPGVTGRALSRHEPRGDTHAPGEWVTADLAVDALEPALQGVDALIHLASAKGTGDADAIATRRLLDAAGHAAVRHVVVISIIGCDRIPLPFYASKVRIEEITRAAGVPWSIVRVAQFHSFVERLVATPATLPLPTPIIADLRFQPVDEREVAERLLDIALGEPLGQAPEFAGPEVLTLGEIATIWLAQQGRSASLVPITLDAVAAGQVAEPRTAGWVSATLAGYRSAANTPAGERTLGRVRFVDWLGQRPATPAARSSP